MVKSISQLTGPALRQTREASTKPPQEIIEMIQSFDWNFHMVGNETPEEVEQLTSMLKAAKRFVSDIMEGKPPRWLTLCGQSGCGKTYLTEKIRDFLKIHGRRAYDRSIPPTNTNPYRLYFYNQGGSYLVKWGDLVETARSGNYRLIKQASSDWVKLVDDIGAAGYASDRDEEGRIKLTPFVLEKLGRLADERLRKWTVLTCNYDRKQIAKLMDARVASRMIRDGNVIIEANIRDYEIRRELMERGES